MKIKTENEEPIESCSVSTSWRIGLCVSAAVLAACAGLCAYIAAVPRQSSGRLAFPVFMAALAAVFLLAAVFAVIYVFVWRIEIFGSSLRMRQLFTSKQIAFKDIASFNVVSTQYMPVVSFLPRKSGAGEQKSMRHPLQIELIIKDKDRFLGWAAAYGIIYPRPLEFVFTLQVLLFILAFIIMAVSHDLIAFDQKQGALRPTILPMLFLPSLVLMVRALLD